MKKFISLLLVVLGISPLTYSQNETFHLTNPTLIPCNLIRSTPPIITLSNLDAPMGPNYRTDKVEEEDGQIRMHKMTNPNALPKGISPATQLEYNAPGSLRSPATLNLQFPGLGYTGVNPSDNNMASGPNHIVQMINNNSSSLMRIWDKSGNIIVNSIILSTITGHSGLGDPVVLYDELANRYLISEFSNTGNHIYICVSQTPDPAGAYFVYDYTTPQFPDYFKLATWGNSYIVTSNENSPAIYALDRTKMLAGIATTTAQRFTIPSYPTIGFQSATPVDVIGTTNAPANSPALFMRMADDGWTATIVDRLEIFSLAVDWVTPANTTLTGPLILPTLPFSTNFCGYLTFSCIPQQGSTVRLDPLREVLMNKILYRNFGTYESIVCTHIDELSGNSHAGVRWYELRKTPSTNWSIYQQSTYGAPADPLHRWMACIGINADNSIGLGYNVAGPTSFPSIRFTGRKDCDPLGTMTEPEQTVIAGTSPNASNRYGDYNGMTVDPVNGSFWFTSNYNPSTQWATRIANFTINSCASSPTFNFVTPSPVSVSCGTATAAITLATTSVNGFVTPINLVASGLPGSTTVSYSVNPVVPGNNTVVTLNNVNTLTPNTYTITITGTAGAEVKTVQLTYIVTGGAGPAVTVHPTPQTLCAGLNTSFSVTSPSATSYQWQLSTTGAGGPWTNINNGGVYSNATTSTLNITGVLTTMDTYQYRCVASITCGSTNSNPALLTVQAPPTITSQPANATVCGGGSTTFCITATGTNIVYQWQISANGCAGAWNNLVNGGVYSGVTTACLTINPASAGMTGAGYRCVVSGTCAPAAISGCGLLTVNTPIAITNQPAASTICAGANTSFTVTATGTTPTYQWQLSTTGAGGPWSNITNGGVYSGATTATLNLTAVTAGMTGYQYRVVVNGAAPCTAVNSNPAILTVNTAPVITTQPVASTTLCAGGNTTFTVAASGTGVTYQWQVSTTGAGGPWLNLADGGVYSGTSTASLTITGATAAMNTYQYRAVATGTCLPAANSNAAALTVHTPITITTQPAATTNICATGSTSLTVAATGTTPSYQWQLSTTGAGGPWTNIANGGVYSGATTTTLTLTAVTAAMNGYQYRAVVTGATPCTPVNSNSAVLNVTPQPVISASVSSILAGQQAILTVNVAPAPGLSFAWYLNGVLVPNATGNSIIVTVNELGNYRVVVTSASGSCQSELKEITATPSTKLFIFPSPNNGIFKVTYYTAGASTANPTKQNITIYDSYGRRVLNKEYEVRQAYQLHQIDMRASGAGVYYVVLREANGNKIKTGEVLVR